MKKRTAKRTKVATQPAESGHLDDTLTEITTTAAQKVKTFRVRILVALGAILVVVVAFSVVNMLGEKAALGLNQRLYELFQGPMAQAEGYVPPADKVEQLVADAKGSTAEKLILKTVGDNYVTRADELSEKAGEDPPSEADAATRAELLEKAFQLAGEAASRHPGDPDLQAWATSVREKVEGERKTDWLPPARSFKPRTPGGTESSEVEPTGATEGDANSPAAEDPPEGGTESDEPDSPEPPAKSAETGEDTGPTDETPG